MSAALLEPIAERIAEHFLGGAAIFADDTTLKMLGPIKGKTVTGRVWTYVRDERPWLGEAPPAAFYRFSEDRAAKRPQKHLETHSGAIHADGYAGFNAL